MNSFLDNRPVVGAQAAPTALPGKDFHPFIPQPVLDAQEVVPVGEAESVPQVEVVTQEGKVQRIIVTCSCCKRIELDCMY